MVFSGNKINIMTDNTILEIEKALRLHINYKGQTNGGRYLSIMDKLAFSYSGSKGEKVSSLLSDYYKEVGVNNLEQALERLREQ